MTLAQAMMAGAACIGSSSGAIPEVIRESGLIVPEGRGDLLAQAIESLLCSKSLRQNLKTKARGTALQYYTNKVFASRYLEEFASLVN